MKKKKKKHIHSKIQNNTFCKITIKNSYMQTINFNYNHK